MLIKREKNLVNSVNIGFNSLHACNYYYNIITLIKGPDRGSTLPRTGIPSLQIHQYHITQSLKASSNGFYMIKGLQTYKSNIITFLY